MTKEPKNNTIMQGLVCLEFMVSQEDKRKVGMYIKTEKGNVDVCPVTKESWEARAEAKKSDCGGQSVYHCLPDSEGRKWEKCVQRTLVIEGNCPIFTSDGFIDWRPCHTSTPKCPNSSYVSDEVYKYSWCYGNNTFSEDLNDHQKHHQIVSLQLVIGVIVLVSAIVASVIFFIYYWKTRKKPVDEEEEVELKTFLPEPVDEEEEVELETLLPYERSSEVVVKEHYVIHGFTTLSKEHVQSIIVLGTYGNLVSRTSRSIMKEYERMKQWTLLQCRFTEIPNDVTENTILFIYGWFGLWNDDLCSLDRVKMAFQNLVDLMKRTKNIKAIIGMRSDLYKKYYQELVKYSDLFQHELYLDSVNINKDAEYLKYFEKALCENKDCQCRQLRFEMLCMGRDKFIGLPLKINILANYHDLMGNYIRDPDILKVMIDAITTLRENMKKTNGCNWIDYICLKGRFSRSEEFDEGIVDVFDLRITKSSFDEADSILRRYVRIRYSDRQNNVSAMEAQYVFWHPFIYICVFHSLFKYNPNLVLKHCNVDAILQLVRPKWFDTAYIEVSADDQGIDLFYERLRQLHLVERYKDHPLVRSASK